MAHQAITSASSANDLKRALVGFENEVNGRGYPGDDLAEYVRAFAGNHAGVPLEPVDPNTLVHDTVLDYRHEHPRIHVAETGTHLIAGSAKRRSFASAQSAHERKVQALEHIFVQRMKLIVQQIKAQFRS